MNSHCPNDQKFFASFLQKRSTYLLPVRIWIVAGFMLLMFGGPAFANGLQCAATLPDPAPFDGMQGIRTKWQITHDQDDRDQRFTVQPDLNNQSLTDWMRGLENAGVNIAEVNIDPDKQLVRDQVISDADWSRYLDDVYNMPALVAGHNTGELSFIAGVRTQMVGGGGRKKTYGYTPAQRDQALVKFLSELETLKSSGQICGNVKFLIHQRLWFREDRLGKKAKYAGKTEAAFAGDMSAFINQARQAGLDHWLAGIRLGENSNKDMNQLLPILVDLATQVNADTDGWLHDRAFLSNGGGWGAYYVGIGNVTDQNGAAYPFFDLMRQQVGSFAFGYKWMDSSTSKNEKMSIGQKMASSACQGGRPCDANSAADWTYFLGTDYGFEELAAFVNANAKSYPMLANVVFVGDSSDSIREMVQPSGGGLTDTPAMTALRGLFMQAASGSPTGGGWKGRVFMNGFSNLDDNTASDDGMSLLFFSGSPMNFSGGSTAVDRASYQDWRCWPATTCQ